MKHFPSAVYVAIAAMLLASTVSAQELPKTAEYTGMCDASAAVPIGPKMFVVANDEDNVLRVYRSDQPGCPVQSFDLTCFLNPDPENPEADVEAASLVGDLVYWISSHGASKKGKPRESRRRLFATEVKLTDDVVTFRAVGVPYIRLVDDLASDPRLKDYNLREASTKPPKEHGGLNIEGLCATPDGKTLLIGFRNPIPDGEALIVPLENPDDVLRGKAAKVGDPIVLSLGGLGIRSIDYCEALKAYLIIAGPYGDEGSFQLFKWSGVASDAPQIAQDINFQDLHPEALIVDKGEKTIQILSDDGDRPVDGKKCKKVAPEKRRFRSIWVNLTKP